MKEEIWVDSRNSCFLRKQLLLSIFFKIVSRDKNISAIRDPNSEISRGSTPWQHLSNPSQVIRGIISGSIDQRSPFPGRSNVFFHRNVPQIYPLRGPRGIFESTTFEQRCERDPSLDSRTARNSKACDEAETRDASYVESTDRFPRSMHISCQSHVYIPRHGIFPGVNWIQVDRREIEWKPPRGPPPQRSVSRRIWRRKKSEDRRQVKYLLIWWSKDCWDGDKVSYAPIVESC